MKNIFLINNNSNAANYGVGTFINLFTNEMSQGINVQISIISLDNACPEFSSEKHGNVIYYTFPKFNSALQSRSIYMRNVFFVMYSYMQNLTDVIIIFNYLHHDTLAGLFRKHLVDVRMHVIVHYVNWCFTLRGNADKFREILNKKDDYTEVERKVLDEVEKEKNFFALMDKIYCLSHFMKEILINDYKVNPSAVFKLNNYVTDSYCELTTQDRASIRSDLSFNVNDKILLYVGRLDEHKGIGYLIQAFAKVYQKDRNIKLVLIGDGDYNLIFKYCQQIWNGIIVTGKLSHDMVCKFYQIADVGILPSLNEQCSYVAIEMMMFGLPIIGTNSTGLNEMLRPIGIDLIDVKGLSCDDKMQETKFIEQLADQLTNYLFRIDTGNIGKKAREHYKATYSFPSLAVV